jgi:hypothetical protein
MLGTTRTSDSFIESRTSASPVLRQIVFGCAAAALLWLVDTYATADCEAERDRCPHIGSDCKPDPSTHAESFGQSELVAHYHADTNANADTYSHNDANADPGCHHALHKRRATRDRWIDDQSSHKCFAVRRATGFNADALVHCRRQ